jgi:hypothetical protein
MQTLRSSSPPTVATSNPQELSSCSVVILRKRDAEVLVSGRAPHFQLPTVEIPVRQRIAPNLLPRIEEHFGLRTVGRFRLKTEQPHPATSGVVVDLIDSRAVTPAGHTWLPVSDIGWDDVAPDARGILWSALAQVHAYATGKLAGRFVGAGWLEEVRAWTENSLAESGLRLEGLSSQHSLGPDFALLRFLTTGPTVWFKAVGPQCGREFAITQILSESGTPHTARVLAVRQEWKGWLTLEAPGRHPDSDASGTDWKVAARCLAELQIASIPHTDALLAAGGRDLRADHLYQAIELCLSRLEKLMKLQPAVPPYRLGIKEFQTIEKQLRQACRRLGILGIPDTVGHSDFNSGNILIGHMDAVFLDWAEGHVGPPFITLAYLELLAGSRFSCHCRRAYLDAWSLQCSAGQIETLLNMTPLLAVFAYVLVCDQPLQSPEDLGPELGRYLRALARRMHIEAKAVEVSVSQ